MGVLGLWDILESVGHPVKVEGLEGKVLGVDANIWLYKFIRGFREKDGASNIESHKLGLFNRISKLLFYRIKPVFVFDGPAPVLKRRTLERRQNTRNKTLSKVQDAAMKALANQLRSQYPDQDIDHLRIKLPELRSNNLVAAEKLGEEDFNLFYLPPAIDKKEEYSDESDSYSDDELEQAIRNSTRVDVNSKEFKSMPPEIQYEILHDIKAKRRRIRNVALPDDASSFSNLQLKRLKERREIQEKIEKCEQEICKNYTGELADGRSVQAFRVQSNKDLRILYCNNTYDPKALEKLKKEQDEVKTDDGAIRDSEVRRPSSLPGNPQATQTSSQSSLMEAEQLSEKDFNLFYLPPEIDKKKEISSDSDSYSDDELEQPIRNSTRVDADSKEFRSMSPEIEYEILHDIEAKERRIRNVALPDDASSSSDLQLKRLNERREIQEKIEKCDQEICKNYSSELADGRSVEAFPAQSNKNPKTQHCNNTYDPKTLEKLEEEQDEVKTDDGAEVRKPSGLSEASYIDLVDDSEAECSKLDSRRLTTGTITIDSSIEDQRDDEPTVVQSISLESSPELESPESEKQQKTDKTVRSQTGYPLGTQSTQISSQSSSQMIPQSEHVANAQRATNKVTNKIIEDAKELLRLFGIPYMDAAGEAEAQCAKLEELNLTMGTITDDSDIWLFGAQNVYRYFFSDDKYVMQYKMPDIEYHIRMTRENLVCFAMLVGSDYTDGIMNVGPVTALEILSEFPGDSMNCLAKFTEWQRSALQNKKLIGDKKRKKLLKYHIPSEFPSRAVYEGYMNPMADSTEEKFSWGTPELDELREYARRNFGWDQKKTDEKLLPVMKRLNEKIQKTIDTFFFKTQANRNPEMFRSKRVNQALNKIAKRAALDTDVVNLSEDDEDS